MDLEKVLAMGAAEEEFSAVYSFKLPPALKERFVAVCLEKNLSTGKVMRELVKQFCDAV